MKTSNDGNPLTVPTDDEERGGIGLALLAWLLGIPGLIVILLLFL